MTFRLRIDSLENMDAQTCIRGRLVEGAYFGPQSIRLKDTTGAWRTTTILSHGMINPQDWPVTADHDTQLILYIPRPASPFVIDTQSLIEGLGSVTLRQNSIDLSKELSNPLFWGNFSTLHMASEIERPYETFLGLSNEDVNNYYLNVLAPLIDSPTWPIFPLSIDSDRYVEVEWAGGAEYQNRVWIGSKASDQRALLGYNSGHFSTPGLRPSELFWLLERLEQTSAHPASGLLLVPMCYFPALNEALIDALANLCTRIPNARVELARDMASAILENLIVPAAEWELKPGFGWCCSSRYSQRNPQSRLSVLSESEFRFIDWFFSAVK
jgi:hypothetical protein